MSAVAALFNVPSTDAELAVWATAHATHHRDINRRLYEILGQNFIEFVLDPIPPDMATWADQHQIMHNNMDPPLGIAGFDLTEVNFKDPELLAAWITLNANEHFQAANTLGIG